MSNTTLASTRLGMSAAVCTGMPFGGFPRSAHAAVEAYKPLIVDARNAAQGRLSAWSPPV